MYLLVHLEAVVLLISTMHDKLNRIICYFSAKAGKEVYARSLSQTKAKHEIIDSHKAMYRGMFNAIVKRVNSSITVGNTSHTNATTSFIEVLDIFGFEFFKVNSFEQLCISICNESLQRKFNLFILKNEQDKYEREGIKSSFISFSDNQEVLNSIGKKSMRILRILDN